MLSQQASGTQKNPGIVAVGMWNVTFGWDEAAARSKPSLFKIPLRSSHCPSGIVFAGIVYGEKFPPLF